MKCISCKPVAIWGKMIIKKKKKTQIRRRKRTLSLCSNICSVILKTSKQSTQPHLAALVIDCSSQDKTPKSFWF